MFKIYLSYENKQVNSMYNLLVMIQTPLLETQYTIWLKQILFGNKLLHDMPLIDSSNNEITTTKLKIAPGLPEKNILEILYFPMIGDKNSIACLGFNTVLGIFAAIL